MTGVFCADAGPKLALAWRRRALPALVGGSEMPRVRVPGMSANGERACGNETGPPVVELTTNEDQEVTLMSTKLSLPVLPLDELSSLLPQPARASMPAARAASSAPLRCDISLLLSPSRGCVN